ncbi:MAG: FmdB family zinc ribbon protein [Actinophytocola sp.]|uniref:FmdB family zinc ribbon protein n=1 Tax=Actinophytocola sp. TaxID=1872138 RepID=UPI003C75D6CE
MPTYQYACTACDHRFDAVQSFSDASLTECPECAGKLRKLYGSVGVVFKGSGFYRTDSRSESKSPATAATSSSSDKSSSDTKTSDKKTSDKPATTPASTSTSSSSSSSSSTDKVAS